MTAFTSQFGEIGYHGLCMTAEEYCALGETDDRYELIHGVVCMSPSPVPRHNEVMYRIMAQLSRHAGLRVFPETDLRLSPATVYRPDICVYKAEALPAEVTRLDLPPSLIVEVLSPKTKPLDLITKRADYERFGVGEYWVVAPAECTVRQWCRGPTGFVERVSGESSVRCEALPGLVLDCTALRWPGA